MLRPLQIQPNPVSFVYARFQKAKREIAPGRWQRVRIEFEFESKNFHQHGHSVNGCDVIVWWRHNWPDCPRQLEVLEFSTVIKSLIVSKDRRGTPATGGY